MNKLLRFLLSGFILLAICSLTAAQDTLPFIMLIYDAENHSLAKKENQLDYTTKVNEFFNHYLLGENILPNGSLKGENILKRR